MTQPMKGLRRNEDQPGN